MEKLTKQKAQELLNRSTSQPHLLQHAIAVSGAMEAMAKHFGEDGEYWGAVGLLHDYDYQIHPEEHLGHTEQPLREAGVDETTIRAIMSHGWEKCTQVKPESNLEKSLYTVDSLTGLISATAKMRPNGIADLTASSVSKKYKDSGFAAKIDREVIRKGVELLNMERAKVIEICIEGMKPYASQLGLMGTAK